MSFAILDNGDMEGQGAEHANCTKCLLWICSMLTSSVAMCHSLTVQTPPSKLSGEIAARKFIEEGANLGNSANLRHSCKSRAKGQAVLREIDLEEAPTNAWPDEGSARGPRPEVPRSASTQSSSMMASCCLRPQLQRCIRRIHFEDVGRAACGTCNFGSRLSHVGCLQAHICRVGPTENLKHLRWALTRIPSPSCVWQADSFKIMGTKNSSEPRREIHLHRPDETRGYARHLEARKPNDLEMNPRHIASHQPRICNLQGAH